MASRRGGIRGQSSLPGDPPEPWAEPSILFPVASSIAKAAFEAPEATWRTVIRTRVERACDVESNQPFHPLHG